MKEAGAGCGGFLGLILVGVVLLFVAWGFVALNLGIQTATAGIFGKAQTHIINESPNNRILQQAGFEQEWSDIGKYDQQVKDAAKAVADWDSKNGSKTDNAIGTLAQQRAYLAQVETGLTQTCQQTIADYNARAREFTAQDWRAADLPEQIDLSQHCQEK